MRKVVIFMIINVIGLFIGFAIPILATISILCEWQPVIRIALVVIFGMEITIRLKQEWDDSKTIILKKETENGK